MFWKLFRRAKTSERDQKVEELHELATKGRRLAIYDRTTGLCAYWYLELRCDEELARARRYSRPLTCLSFWVRTPALIERAAQTIGESIRDHDLAGYLNNGHFMIVLPDTDSAGAQFVLERIGLKIAGEFSCSMVTFPEDGGTFDELLAALKSPAGHAA